MRNLLNSTKQYLQIVNHQTPLHTLTPKEVRKIRENAPKPKLQQTITLSKVENVQIQVRDGSTIKGRVYIPKGKGPFPVIVYYHGGGWVLNSIETSDASCRLLAAQTKSIVVSVDYRLAPEYKFPTPVFDAYDAFLWTVEHVKEWNGVESQIAVAGDSAGANLATVVTLLNKKMSGPTISAQILLYPVTDLNFNTSSYEQFKTGYGLEKKDMEWFKYYYLNDESEINNPFVSPLQSEDVRDLPQALIIVAENDVLRDEGIAYGNKLSSMNVKVEQHIAKGLVHSYFTKNEIFTESISDTIKIINNFMKHNVVSLEYV